MMSLELENCYDWLDRGYVYRAHNDLVAAHKVYLLET